jgi:uncharacterized membrane protein YhhN
MPTYLIILLAVLLLTALLYFERQANHKAVLPIKTLLSCLFIITAVFEAHPLPGYFYLLLIGLIFCLGGDICLALPRDRMFLYGLISFLLGHVFYIIAFFYVAHLNSWTWFGSGLCAVLSGGIYFWLRPHLGSMNVPVLGYVIVITLMVAGAWSIFGSVHLAWNGRLLVFIGALGFYVSDVFVARNRFIKPEFLNRSIGLPLYYGGQFLLAFSVGLLR